MKEEILKLIREKREEIKQLEDETPSEHYYRDGYNDALDYIEPIVSRVELPVKPEIAVREADERAKNAFTELHQILSNSKYGMNDCNAREKIYRVLNDLQRKQFSV